MLKHKLPPLDKPFGMEEAELKRNFIPMSLEWRLTRLAETLANLFFWWR